MGQSYLYSFKPYHQEGPLSCPFMRLCLPRRWEANDESLHFAEQEVQASRSHAILLALAFRSEGAC